MPGEARFLRLLGMFVAVLVLASPIVAATPPNAVNITMSNESGTEGEDLVFGASVSCFWQDPNDIDPNYTIELRLETGGGSATGGGQCNDSTDYLNVNNLKVEFECGSNSGLVTVTTCANDADDGDRTFMVRQAPSGGNPPPELQSFTAGTGTIEDDDEAPPPPDEEPPPPDEEEPPPEDPGLSTVKLSVSPKSIREDSTADVTISRTGTSAQMAKAASGQVTISPDPSTANASQRDITAFENIDTGGGTCTFSFAGTSAKSQTATCRVFPNFGPNEAGADDQEERFVLRFSGINGANKGGSQTLTIRDVDGVTDPGTDPGDDDPGTDPNDPVDVDLTSPFAPGTPQRSVAGALENACRTGANVEIRSFCTYLRDDLDGGEAATPANGQRAGVIRELTPVDISAQADIGLQATRGQVENMWERMRQVRRGNREKVGARLAMNLGGQPLMLDSTALLESLDATEEEWDPLAGLFSPMPAQQDAGGADGYGTVDESAIRYFVNGHFSLGNHDETELEKEWEVTSAELTVGVDKLLGDAVLIGGALGYFTSETDFADDGGVMDARGLSLGLYSMYYYGTFYLSGTLGYGDSDYQSIRRVQLPTSFRGLSVLTPRASPGGTQTFGSVTFGWDRKRTKSALGVFLRGNWANVEIDSYTETDGGPINMQISDQELQSLIGEVGVDWAYSSEYRWGVMRPSLRVSALKEFENSSRLIAGAFDLDTVGHNFLLRTDDPDEEFYRAGAGLTFAFFNGGSIYVFYDTQLDRDDHDFDTITAGLNLDF